MQETLTNNIYSIFYLFLWIITLIWYQYKRNYTDAGSFIMFMYIIYALFSVLTINDPLFSAAFNKLKLFPYIYLYGMMMIAMMPIVNLHLHPVKSIEATNSRILDIIAGIIIVSSILIIPSVIEQAGNGILNLFVDETAGKDAYMNQVEEAENSGKSIRNLPAIIYNSLTDISVFLLFYFMTLKEKKSKPIMLGLAFSVALSVVIPITHGQRGGVVTGVLTIVGGYFLFKSFISKRANTIIKRIGIAFIAIISLPIIAITVSRFGQENAGVGGFVNWYVGQGSLYFNNFGLNPGGTRHGDRTINMFKRVIDPNTPKNFVERRDKYHNLDLDDNYFSTFVGDFTIDFGPFAAFVFFCIGFYILYKCSKADNEEIKLRQLLMVYFAICISLQGGMTLFSYSDTGNIRIIMLIGLYAYLSYHEQLLNKFPKKENETI